MLLKLLFIVAAFEWVTVASGSERCHGRHEYYEKCVKTCDPQTCEGAGKTLHCPVRSKCKGGCRCKHGYLRNENGECIPSEKCDNNENFNLSSTYYTPTSKVAIKKSHKQNHKHTKNSSSFLSETDSSLSSVSQSSSSKKHSRCGLHEVWSECTNEGCGRRKCSDLASPEVCKDPAKGQCRPGCICKNNYLRNRLGVCVPISKCPEPKCRENEIYLRNKESVNRPQTCWQYLHGFDETTHTQGPECICKKHHARNNDGRCISVKHCGIDARSKRSVCNSNEEYVSNIHNITRPQNCWRYILGFPKQRESKVTPGCICVENYVRDYLGICVPTKECDNLMLNG